MKKPGSIFRLSWIAALFLLWCSPAQSQPKPVMVHYMPWYVAKPYSKGWGWHWTMNHFNPDIPNAQGQRPIASQYYPLIGPYDSLDPAVIEYHVLLMKLAGIDGVIVDWYGQDNYYDYHTNDLRTAALLKCIEKAGMKFSLCYEDATITAEISGGTNNFGIGVTPATAVAHAQQTLLFAQSNYFASTSYLRLNGQPVFLNFGPQYFTQSSQWTSIFSVLNVTNQPAFFPEDNRLNAAAGAFDWPPMWASQPTGGSNVLSAAALQNYLVSFDQKAAAWPAYVSSAFPRFHDIYAQAGVGSSYGYLSDNGGATFRDTLQRAMTNASEIIQLVTWNDYGEGTIIEPTVQYGYRDLGVVQDFRRQYLDPGFAYSTNDLKLATRFYSLRQQFVSNSIVSAELDRTFSNIVSGNLAVANQQLAGMESARPVIYNLSFTDGQLQFLVGGYLSTAGIQVQTTSDLTSTDWQAVSSFPASTNPPGFSVPVSLQSTSTFFRVRNSDHDAAAVKHGYRLLVSESSS
jgi:Glycosyl hydrolase family 71